MTVFKQKWGYIAKIYLILTNDIPKNVKNNLFGGLQMPKNDGFYNYQKLPIDRRLNVYEMSLINVYKMSLHEWW